MADINIDGIVTWLKNWFYDKTEITGYLNNKANVSDLQTTNSNLNNLSSTVSNKVDKVTGKGLSTEDFTTSLKDKLDGIEAEANKTVVDSALSSTSTNPVQNKVVNTALGGKAPTNHSSSATTYGVGTSSNYGHNKVINNLTTSSHTNGYSLSAYQGKVLKDLIDDKSDFSGSYDDLTDVPSSFPPSTHSHSTENIIEPNILPNLGITGGLNQHTINHIFDDAIGNLSSIEAIKVVSDKGTASASTMNKLYIEDNGSTVDVYYTVKDGSNYSWSKLDSDILDDLSIDWDDITNKPSSFTPSSHTHGNISNDGKITQYNHNRYSGTRPIIAQIGSIIEGTTVGTLVQGHIDNWFVFDVASYPNLDIDSFTPQSGINLAFYNALNNKGALTDDVDWTYNSDGFTNGIKLVDKTTNANGRITLHLKS